MKGELTVGAVGSAFTVTVAVVVAFEQPPVPLIVYVITEVPAVPAVITPVDELIFATPVVAEDQDPPEIEAINVVVPFEQTLVVPEIVVAVGAAVTVTVLVAVAFGHPFVPVTV